ncbi:Gfo/Idh/MocA family protein [Sphingomonas sp. R86521]|uniref:Gfo/Idh/MocA family protein n=1 Tax=Sphingomonas sp. R86521 TaxID=3093860 RepID=UPI0036D3158C
MTRKLKVGLIGAHAWADKAHLPGLVAHDGVELVAICDTDRARAEAAAAKFGAGAVYTDYREMLADPTIEMIDVCTPTATHLPLSLAAIDAGKHVLSEKPLHTQAAPAFEAAARAKANGVRTKLGFTFRYSPAIRRLQEWVASGELGEIFHIHGFEQNSQFLDPDFELRQFDVNSPRDRLIPASIVGYGSHLIDLMRWIGGEFDSVVSTMSNYVPERLIRGLEGRQRFQVEDGTVALVEYAGGTQGMLQTSYVAVGNYPGVEIRVYGSKGAAVARLISEYGVAETLHRAAPNSVEFAKVELGDDVLPPGTTLATPWPELYYRNLIRYFTDEILEDRPEECTFYDGAKSQEIVDAIVRAHTERRWVKVGEA